MEIINPCLKEDEKILTADETTPEEFLRANRRERELLEYVDQVLLPEYQPVEETTEEVKQTCKGILQVLSIIKTKLEASLSSVNPGRQDIGAQ